MESSRGGAAEGRWAYGVLAPLRKCGAEEVGRETEDEEEEAARATKGAGRGEAGVARKGTAAGRSGEEKTGGPGGVLKCGAGPGLPRADAGEKAFGGAKTAGNGGDACAGCGGVSSMPALLEIGGGEHEAQIRIGNFGM